MNQHKATKITFCRITLFMMLLVLLQMGDGPATVYAQSKVNVLLSITDSSDGIAIKGFVPMKSLTGEPWEDNALIKVVIIGPSGKSYIKTYRAALVEGFLLKFPSDINKRQKRAPPGRYKLRINVNKENVWNTRFTVLKDGSAMWKYYKYYK